MNNCIIPSQSLNGQQEIDKKHIIQSALNRNVLIKKALHQCLQKKLQDNKEQINTYKSRTEQGLAIASIINNVYMQENIYSLTSGSKEIICTTLIYTEFKNNDSITVKFIQELWHKMYSFIEQGDVWAASYELACAMAALPK